MTEPADESWSEFADWVPMPVNEETMMLVNYHYDQAQQERERTWLPKYHYCREYRTWHMGDLVACDRCAEHRACWRDDYGADPLDGS